VNLNPCPKLRTDTEMGLHTDWWFC